MFAFLFGSIVGLFMFGSILHKMPLLPEEASKAPERQPVFRDEDGIPWPDSTYVENGSSNPN